MFGGDQPGEHLLVLGAKGRVLLPANPPKWALGDDLRARVGQIMAEPSGTLAELGGKERLLYATRVGDSSLRVLLVANAEDAIAPIRARLLPQLVLLATLQLVTLSVFAWFMRRQVPAVVDHRGRVRPAREDGGARPGCVAHRARGEELAQRAVDRDLAARVGAATARWPRARCALRSTGSSTSPPRS